MDDESVRPAAYLDALGEIHRSLSHATRSQLGNLSLHVGLLGEIVKRTADPDTQVAAQWERNAGKVEADVQRIVAAVERVLKLTRGIGEAETSFDLRAALIDAETLLAPYFRERRLEWSLSLPPDPMPARGRRDLIDRLLIVGVVDAARALPEGGRMSVRLQAGGTPGAVCIECSTARGRPTTRELRLPVGPAAG